LGFQLHVWHVWLGKPELFARLRGSVQSTKYRDLQKGVRLLPIFCSKERHLLPENISIPLINIELIFLLDAKFALIARNN
jgi:hypothetical protein